MASNFFLLNENINFTTGTLLSFFFPPHLKEPYHGLTTTTALGSDLQGLNHFVINGKQSRAETHVRRACYT